MRGFGDSTDPETEVPLFCGVSSWLKPEHDNIKYTNQAGEEGDDEQGGWDSVHGKWWKENTICDQ